jgi:2'-5' RNA ligase
MGFDPGSGLTGGVARLFLAVWPPAEVVATLARLPRDERPGLRYVPPENWHVTLRFFGEADAAEVARALDGVGLPPSSGHLGPRVTRLFKGVVGVRASGLDELASITASATQGIGEPPSPEFVGHLTVARHKPHADVGHLLHAPVDAVFVVRQIALVESRIDHRGARYQTVAAWPVH